jgi:hypothetical protein
METDRRRERLLSDGDATTTGVEAGSSGEESLRKVNRPFGAGGKGLDIQAPFKTPVEKSMDRRQRYGQEHEKGRLQQRRHNLPRNKPARPSLRLRG